MGLCDLLDMLESWLIDDCPPDARDEYRAQLHRPVTREAKQADRRREMLAVAVAMDGEIT